MKLIRIDAGRFAELEALHKAYKVEIGEELPRKDELDALRQAISDGKILFFGCVCAEKLVACCSVSRVFSTFNYAAAGVFEDFYIIPEWRHRGIARSLVEFAYRESGAGSMTVGCADCDEGLYRALGFDVRLGNMLVYSEN